MYSFSEPALLNCSYGSGMEIENGCSVVTRRQSFCSHRMWIVENKLLKCAISYIFSAHSSLEMNFTCSLLTWEQSATHATGVRGDSQLVPQFDAIQWAQPDLPRHSKKVNLVRVQHMGIGGNVIRE